jgi:hypothetical protein
MREAARLIQLWQSMEPAHSQLHAIHQRDASRIIAFWPSRLREHAADDPIQPVAIASDAARTQLDERAVVEQMARGMNVATDGHDRYWSGYVKSAEAAYKVVMHARAAEAQAGATCLRALIANDAYAMCFQTMDQYRAALLKCTTPPEFHDEEPPHWHCDIPAGLSRPSPSPAPSHLALSALDTRRTNSRRSQLSESVGSKTQLSTSR